MRFGLHLHCPVQTLAADPIFKKEIKLTASDAAEDDLFGISVSISGNTAVVGALRDDDGGSNSGSVHVFVRSGAAWSQQQKLTAADAAENDEFSRSVSISGDTVIVGSYMDDDAGGNSGSAYIFTRSGSTWTQQQKLTASDAAMADHFGYSAAISGDTAIVGAVADDDGGSMSGSAYIFTRSGSIWNQQQKLTAADDAGNDWFGNSVSISGDTAIVGAFQNDDAGGDSGSAYIFTRNGAVWTQQQKLTAADAAGGDKFGIAVSIAGDVAVVGGASR